MSGAVRKAGVDFNVGGNFEKRLDSFIKRLEKTEKLAGGLNKLLNGPGARAGQASDERALMAALKREKAEAQILGIRGKASAQQDRAALAQERRDQRREMHISRLARAEQAHLDRITQGRDKADRDALMGQARITTELRKQEAIEARIRKLQAEPPKPPKRNGGGKGDNLYGTGQSMYSNGMSILEGFKPALDAAARVNHERVIFAQLGMTEQENRKAFQAARQITKGLRGVKETDVLEALKDTFNVTKNLQESIELSPMVAKFLVSSRNLYHATDGQVADMLKAAEMNAKGKTPEAFRDSFVSNLELQSKIQSGTQGRLRGADFLNQAKMGGMARFQLTDDAKIKMAALGLEQGGSRSGQSLMTLVSALAFGQMTAKAATALDAHHLVLPGGLDIEKGKIKGLKAGGLVDSDMLVRDPFAWIGKHFAPVVNQNVAKFGPEKGTAQGYVEVGSMLSARNSKAFAVTGLAQAMNIEREVGIAHRAKGIQDSYDNYMGGYDGANTAQRAAYENALVRVGEDVLPMATKALNGFADALERLTDYADRHPMRLDAAVKTTAAVGVGMAIGGPLLMGAGMFSVMKGARAAASSEKAVQEMLELQRAAAAATSATATAEEGMIAGASVAGSKAGASVLTGIRGAVVGSASAVFSPVGVTIAASIAAGVAGYFAGHSIGEWIGGKIYGTDEERDAHTRGLQDKAESAQRRNARQFGIHLNHPLPGPWAPGYNPTPNGYGVLRSTGNGPGGQPHVSVYHHPDARKTTFAVNGRRIPPAQVKHIPAPGHG